jgi:hypothetical protein
LDPSVWTEDKKATEVENEALIALFSEEKIKEALF